MSKDYYIGKNINKKCFLGIYCIKNKRVKSVIFEFSTLNLMVHGFVSIKQRPKIVVRIEKLLRS